MSSLTLPGSVCGGTNWDRDLSHLKSMKEAKSGRPGHPAWTGGKAAGHAWVELTGPYIVSYPRGNQGRKGG